MLARLGPLHAVVVAVVTDDETPIELLYECPNCWQLHQIPNVLCVNCEKDGVVLT